MLPMRLAKTDADAIERVAVEVPAAHGVAAVNCLGEILDRGRKVREHHLPPAPVLPHRAREHHRAVVHLSFAMEFGPAKCTTARWCSDRKSTRLNSSH